MSDSKNKAEQRRELNGIVYFDRGTVEGKEGRSYDIWAVQTHFVQVGESQTELVKKYILPLAQPGDCLAFTAKVMAMCTKSVVRKEDVHPGFLANFLSRFATETVAGIGVKNPHKMQLAINMVGAPKVLWAAVCSAVTKVMGKKGVFWEIVGPDVAGIDGFYYRSSFETYHDLALINPKEPVKLCNQLEKETGIPVVLMDANDIDQNQLGKCDDFPLTDAMIQEALRYNPCGQGDELTPLIIIRPHGVK